MVSGSVDLEDDFGVGPEAGVKIGKPKMFCNPVVKVRQAELVEPTHQLTCYKIRSGEPERTVEIEN